VEIFTKFEGYVSLSLSDPPLKTLDFLRYGWVLFENEQLCMKALDSVGSPTAGGVTLNIIQSNKQKKFVKIATPFDKNKLDTHFDLSKKLIET